MARFWLSRGRWMRPRVAGDEYGRRTAAVPIVPGFVALVVALYTCRCSDCDDVREQFDRTGWPA